jgi:hypothetical protein
MRSTFRITWKQLGCAAQLLIVLSAAWIQPLQAQSQDRQQDIQQLKDELQQLDQKMDDIKAKINALETVPPSAPSTTRNPTKAQKPSSQSEATVAIPAEAVTPARPAADLVPLEGEITEKRDSVDFYGFAMLDSGYDFGQINPAWFDVVRPTQLPSFANEFGP